MDYVKQSKRPIIIAFLVFIGAIVLMAGVYEVMWLARPDFFRIQTGLNLLPLEVEALSRKHSAYEEGEPLPRLTQETSIEARTQDVLNAYASLQVATVALAADSRLFNAENAETNQQYKEFEKSQFRQYDEYIKEQTAPYEKRAELLRQQMKALLSAAGVSDEDKLSSYFAVTYFTLKQKVLQIESEEVAKEVEAREYGLKNLVHFQGEPQQQAYLRRQKSSEDLRTKVLAEEQSCDNLGWALRDASGAYRDALRHRLNYIDFVYFSVGAATTATFGDIAPNASPVRLLVCVQVLISIGLSGFLISRLSSAR